VQDFTILQILLDGYLNVRLAVEIAIPFCKARMSVLHFSLGATSEAIHMKLKWVGKPSIDADKKRIHG
jgi:hypothetical protein